MPPIQNTLDSQPSEAAVGEKPPSPTPAPAGPSATPQLPQLSLVDKLNEVAEEPAVLPAAVGTEDSSIAFVTTPGLAEGIQTTTDAAGKAGSAGKSEAADAAGKSGSAGKSDAAETGGPTAGQDAGKAKDEPSAEALKEQSAVPKRASRAAKVAASAKISNSAAVGSGGKRASTASRPSAEKETASCPSAEKKKVAGPSAADSNNKENNASAPPTEEANHMAEKEPHSRVGEAQGGKMKKAGKAERDPMIGRCVKKDFETDKGVKTYTGWVIGKHATKPW